MRRLVVGDIHGCFQEFQDLLDWAGLSADDEIIALGDMVDRGPESPEVAAFFQTHPRARAIMGNHERKHVRIADGALPPRRSQIITREQFAAKGADYAGACAFFAVLPLFLELPEAILVHGFLEPGMALEHQEERVLLGNISGEKYLRQRFSRPWYELYQGKKPLVAGHLDYRRTGEPLVYKDLVFAIDTGCCHGRRLTGLLLPEFRLLSVPSRGDHWKKISKAWAKGAPR